MLVDKYAFSGVKKIMLYDPVKTQIHDLPL